MVPEPAEPVGIASELRIVVEPGDLLCFSGAHLHGQRPQRHERRSLQRRGPHRGREDETPGRGEANLDGDAPRVALDWFRNVMDGMPMPAGIRREVEHTAERYKSG